MKIGDHNIESKYNKNMPWFLITEYTKLETLYVLIKILIFLVV